MLMCNVKNCKTNNFPLKIKATQVERVESEFRPEFIKHMLNKIDWTALVSAAKDVGITIPDTLPENRDEEFLKNVHHVLLDIHVKEGEMTCPHCNRSYPISQGIPNMLLKEDEM
jgi:multifunctional methyltransferase subunit TRM112